MSRYVKSVSDTRKLTKSLQNLTEEFGYHKDAVKNNNKQLEKLNSEIEKAKEKELKLLKQKINELETQTRWVKSSEPAVQVTEDYILKKLDVL